MQQNNKVNATTQNDILEAKDFRVKAKGKKAISPQDAVSTYIGVANMYVP